MAMSPEQLAKLSDYAKSAILFIYDASTTWLCIFFPDRRSGTASFRPVYHQNLTLDDVRTALDASGMHYDSSDGPEDYTVLRIIHPTPDMKLEDRLAKPTLSDVLKMDWLTVVSDPKMNKASAYCDNAERRHPRCFKFEMGEDQVIQALTTQGDQFRLEKGPRGLQLFIRQFN